MRNFSSAPCLCPCLGLAWVCLYAFCLNIIMAGGSLKPAKEMIGHKTLSMTDRYAHLEAVGRNPVQEALASRYASGAREGSAGHGGHGGHIADTRRNQARKLKKGSRLMAQNP